jgi:hypothetical protein
MTTNEKRCSTCKQWRNRAEFNRRARSSDGLQPTCRLCNAARSKQYYRENREKHLAAVGKQRHKQSHKLRAALSQVKRHNGCCCCSEAEPVALDFHHMRDKAVLVSKLPSLCAKWSRVVAELVKCVVICANCHRKVTAGLLEVPTGAECKLPEGLGALDRV